MGNRTIKDVDSEMRELYPKKELAYMDYMNNSGNSEIRQGLWDLFERYRNRWNKLVDEYESLKK